MMAINASNRRYFDEIDVVKGIAILTVLWHHSMIRYPIYMLDIPWCRYARHINATYFLVVFFLVSGYLFAHSRPKPFIETLGDKVRRLLVPYLSFELINTFFKLMSPELVNRKIESVGAYVEKVLLYGGELWFVYCLFLIFVVWPPILQRIEKPAMCGAVLLLCVLNVLMPKDVMGGVLLYPQFVFYSIFFVAGYLLRDMDRGLLQDGRLFLVVSVLFLVFCVFCVESIKIPYIGRYLKCAIGCFFVWMLSFRILKYKRISRLLAFAGRYSLPYYWLNGFALVVARALIVSVLHVSFTPMIAICIFLICVVLETVGILVVRRWPYVRCLIGIK